MKQFSENYDKKVKKVFDNFLIWAIIEPYRTKNCISIL